jgi:hypothetical protein
LFGDRLEGYLAAEEFFDLVEPVFFGGDNKGVSGALAGGAGGTANAVYVVFAIVRHIVIDNEVYILDIYTAAEDIGSYEYLELVALEVEEHLFAFFLLEVALYLSHGKARAAQLFVELLYIQLAGAEYEYAAKFFLLEYPGDEWYLLRIVHQEGALHNGFGRLGDGNVDFHGVVEHGVCQLAYGRGHGGREEEVLPLLGQVRYDLYDVFEEAHVEHAVGLIEYEIAEVAELHIAHVEVRDHAAGGADDYIHAAGEGLALCSKGCAAGAAIHFYKGDIGIVRYAFEGLGYLHSELARGHNDHGIDGVGIVVVRNELVQQWQQEGCGFAGACLRGSNDVFAGNDSGYYGFLHGSGGIVAHGIYAIEQVVIKTKFCEFQDMCIFKFFSCPIFTAWCLYSTVPSDTLGGVLTARQVR